MTSLGLRYESAQVGNHHSRRRTGCSHASSPAGPARAGGGLSRTDGTGPARGLASWLNLEHVESAMLWTRSETTWLGRPPLTEAETEAPEGQRLAPGTVSQWNPPPTPPDTPHPPACFPAQEFFPLHQHHLQFLTYHPTHSAGFSTRKSGPPITPITWLPRGTLPPWETESRPRNRRGPGAHLLRGG